MSLIRIQKYIAESGFASRRSAEKLVEEGRVRVNGTTVSKLGLKIDPSCDVIKIGNKVIRPALKGALLFNKPRAVVCSMSDPEGRRCLADFLTSRYRSYFSVGRLDWNTTGLLILTNDGELAQKLAHPSFGWERIYKVRVEGHVPEGVFAKLEQGVRLAGKPIKLSVTFLNLEQNSTWLEMRLREGQYQVVRRIFRKVGFPVLKLQRVQFGPFRLGKLPAGQIKVLSEREYQLMRKRVMQSRVG